MPQSNNVVGEVDIRNDMNHYYRHCVVTYNKPTKDGPERCAAWIDSYHVDEENQLKVHIRVLPRKEGTEYGDIFQVSNDLLDYNLPPLGMVEYRGHWLHLSRTPARRMRKGYNDENITWASLEDDGFLPDHGPCYSGIVRQVWYGSPERVNTNVVVWNKGIYYMTDKVATIDDQGSVILIPNKEKLGEFVCKALANNWESVTSKHSVRTLPSSVPMP